MPGAIACDDLLEAGQDPFVQQPLYLVDEWLVDGARDVL
jgi:hypothetical protein